MNVRENIEQAIQAALTAADISVVPGSINLEFPADIQHGDYSSNAALQHAKSASLSPRALADKIVGSLGRIEGVSKVEIAGPGFINFYLSSEAVAQKIDEAAGEEWGKISINAGKKIMVEYTDPNPFKAFHIGHLMSNTIGETISRLFESSGARVTRANYQGDVGLHVAKAIWGMKKIGASGWTVESIGQAYATGANAYEGDEASKKEIDELNKKIFEIAIEGKHDESEEKKLYDEGRKISLDHFEEIYKKLGTHFDAYFFESATSVKGKTLVENHPDIFVESDGAVVFHGEDYGLHTRVFLNKAGLPTYEAKDLGLIELKQESGTFDVSISVTASEQSEYFKVILEAARHIPEIKDFADRTRHVSHGMMRLPTGKMSSRTGDVITGESLLAELTAAAKERAAESRAEDHDVLSLAIAVAAIKYQILKQASGKDIVFERERALSLEGDSGPYLQYAYARTCAILAKASESRIDARVDAAKQPTELMRFVSRFSEIVERAAQNLEPHLVTNYLLDVASRLNAWYAQEQILDGTSEASHKVAVVAAVSRTLKNGLWVLGIPAPEKM